MIGDGGHAQRSLWTRISEDQSDPDVRDTDVMGRFGGRKRKTIVASRSTINKDFK